MSIISMQSQVKKINCYRKNAQNYLFFFRKQMAAILLFVIFNII